MNRYTIFCTKNQTMRAYKLGAPIITNDICEAYPPTAEQMCGWLREKGFQIAVSPCGNSDEYSYFVVSPSEEIRIGAGFKGIMPTYKDALLSAIDAALDSLEKGK